MFALLPSRQPFRVGLHFISPEGAGAFRLLNVAAELEPLGAGFFPAAGSVL